MFILWLDIKAGTDLVTSSLDGFSDHLTSKLDGFGNHLDSILDACSLSHLALIVDARISKLAEIIAIFNIRASKIKAR
jgi:hypothetical protein